MTKTTTMFKRFVSLLVVYVMLISVMPSALASHAQQFSDFPTGWSRPAMEAAVNNGLLVGIGGGEIGPKKNLTRAEMASVMVRAFGATTYSDISMYRDVDSASWYYNDISKAVQMEAITGVSPAEMAPEEYITREQVFSILSRILALSSNNEAALSRFKDAGNVSAWAKSTVIPLVERGYVNGDGNGYLNPKSYITREEFAQLMYSTIRRYITTPGTYSEDMEGIVVLRCGNVTLKDMYVEGDLVVGDGAAKSLVNLEGITINGRLLTRGGTNYLKDTTVKYGVVVLNPNGITAFRNYRNEAPFAGIIEYTKASFLTNAGSNVDFGGGATTKHTVKFKLFAGDTEAYAEIKVANGKKIGAKLPDAPDPSDIPGYTFNGWVDGNGDPVTADTRVYDGMTVVADLTPIVTPPTTYKVTFKLFAGDTTPYAEIDVVSGQQIGGQMPADPMASQIPGYTFNGWVDGNGDPVTDVTYVTGAMTVVADLTPIVTPPTTYKVTFKLFAGDTTPYAEIDVVSGQQIGGQMPADPMASQIPGYTFNGWVDGNGDPVTDVTYVTGAMTVVADLTPIVTPPTTYKVIFKLFAGDTTPYAEIDVVSGQQIGGQMPADPMASQIPGYTFNGWVDGNGDPVTDVTYVTGAMTVVADLTPIVTPPTTYKVTFKLFAGDTTPYAEIDVVSGQQIGGQMPADPMASQIPGYTFNGWVDGNGDPVTDVTYVTGAMTVVADLTPIVTPPTTYKVTFKLFAGDTTPYAEIDVVSGQQIGGQMPADPMASQIPGYTFNGWVDGNGDPVTDVTYVTGAMTVVADLTPIVTPPTTYKVTFKLFAGDTTPYAEIDVVSGQQIGGQMPADPMASQIPGYTFNGWVDGNGDPVTDVTYVTGAMTVVADLAPIVTPPDTITVEFYEGYGRFAPQIGSTLTLTLDASGEASVAASDIPANIYSWTAYTKSEYMEAGYADYDGKVDVKPQFMYYNGTEWLPFDETVVLTEDTTVHMFYKYIGLSGFETEVSTRYTDETRLVDSLISLSDNAKVQLDAAKSTGLDIYENIDGTIYGLLESKNLIDDERYIMKLDIGLPFSKVTTKSIANGMVKKYVRQMIADPAKLDQLLGMVDINDLVSYIDKDAFISSLTDDEIVQIIKKAENRDIVVDFVMADLQNSESALIDIVLEYVSDALTTDADLRNAVAAELKEIIAGNDTTAKNLRKVILKSDSLESILENDGIEDAVIELIIDVDNGVLDVILNNSDNTLKKEIIEEISHYTTFISEIVRTSSFKDYALGLIRLGGSEYDDVSLKILNSDTAKRQILDAVENSSELQDLLKNDAVIRADIMNSIEVDEEELLEFVFDIDGATDYSDIVSSSEIESYFDTVPGYSLCTTPDEKKLFKNSLYADATAKAEALAEIQSKIAEYKEEVLDDFADGTLTDTDLIEAIEDKMIDYVRKYIDKESINSDLEEVIEDHILDYVADLIVNPTPADSVLAEVKASLDADMDEFIATAHQNATVLTAIKNFVKNHHDDEMKDHIGNIYDEITPVLATYIKGIDETSDIYVNIDGALQTAASSIPTSVIADIIKDKSNDADVLKLLKLYIQDEDNADVIEDYVDSFIDTIDASFVAANRTVINNLLQNIDLDGYINSNPSDALQFVKDHIATLNDDQKIAFADNIFNMVSATTEYKNIIDDLFVDNELEITPENLTILKVLSLTIRDLEMGDALSFTNNSKIEKIIDLVGEDYIEDQYEIVRDNYCDGLDDAIELVDNGSSTRETYTTSLIFVLDPIYVLEKAYNKVQPKVVEKLVDFDVRYDENPYLQYLVEHDVIDRLFIDTGVATGNRTAYKLRDITEYAAYMVELEIAVNDAILWYGEELTDAEFDAIYDSVFAKIYTANDKLDKILEDFVDNGELPSQLEDALSKVKKINDLYLKFEPKLKSIVNKYLNSSIHDKLVNESLDENERIQTAIDILLGQDDPVFTIDSLFDIFYNYDDKMQEKLQKLLDSGKLDTAIEKFKASPAGDKISDTAINNIIEIIENVAEYGVEYYQVDTSSDITVIEQYKITIDGKEIIFVRRYEF